MDTQTESDKIGESETNYNKSGVDNVSEVKINTTESTAEIAEVARKKVSGSETVNALIEDRYEEKGAEDKNNDDHSRVDVVEEIKALPHSNNYENENIRNVENKELEAIGKSLELETIDNIFPTQEPNSEGKVQLGMNDNPDGGEDTEASIHVIANATDLVVENSEAQGVVVIPSPEDERITADGINETGCTNETTDESLLSDDGASSKGVLETSAEFRIKEDSRPTKSTFDASIVPEKDHPAASTENVISNIQAEYDCKVEPASKQDDGKVDASLGQEAIKSGPPLDVPQHVTDEASCSKIEQNIGSDARSSTDAPENPILIKENTCVTPVENNPEEIAKQNETDLTELSTDSSNALSKTTDTWKSNRESPSKPVLSDSVATSNVGNEVIHANNSLTDTHEISTKQVEDEETIPVNNMPEGLNENKIKLTETKVESISESSSDHVAAHDADQITGFSEMSTETAAEGSSVSADTTPETHSELKIVLTGDKMKNQPQLKQETTRVAVESVTIASEFDHEHSPCTSANLTTERAESSNLSQTVVVETTVIKTEIIEKKFEKSDDVGALASRLSSKDVSQNDRAENDDKDDKSTEITQDVTLTIKDDIHQENVTPSTGNEEKDDQEEVTKSKEEEKKASPSNEEVHESKVENNAESKEDEPIQEKIDMKRSQGCCVIS